jgi:2-haloacid dehalogenase
VHIATSLYTDVQPCMKLKIPVIWVNRKKEEIEGTRKPDAIVKDFRGAVTLLKA